MGLESYAPAARAGPSRKRLYRVCCDRCKESAAGAVCRHNAARYAHKAGYTTILTSRKPHTAWLCAACYKSWDARLTLVDYLTVKVK